MAERRVNRADLQNIGGNHNIYIRLVTELREELERVNNSLMENIAVNLELQREQENDAVIINNLRENINLNQTNATEIFDAINESMHIRLIPNSDILNHLRLDPVNNEEAIRRITTIIERRNTKVAQNPTLVFPNPIVVLPNQ